MNIEEIRKNAPEGSESYMLFSTTVIYFGKSHGDTMYFYNGGWYLYNGAFYYDKIKPLY